MYKFLFIFILGSLIWSLISFSPTPQATMPTDKSYNITDESGQQLLMRVSVKVNPGDELLLEDNRLYKIIKVEGTHAYASFVKTLYLP